MIDKQLEENLRASVRFAFKNVFHHGDFKNDLINIGRRARNIVDDEMNKIFWEIQNGKFKED